MCSRIYLFCLMAFSMIFVLPAAGQIVTTGKRDLTQTRVASNTSTCVTKNNDTGICVHYTMCNDDHEIEVGGRITEGELRTISDCNTRLDEWCCSRKKVIKIKMTTETTVTVAPPKETTVTRKTVRNCVASERNDCPWLAKLYRRGEDYSYCLGAMIGSRIILTTATCVLQAQNQFLWIRVPNSANPEANYTIISRLSHPKYNSGTRLNDIALLSLLNDIDWGFGGQKGACIDTQQSLGGECIAANVNEYDDVDMVSLSVTPGSCNARANVVDAMCGNGLFLDSLVTGAPIMCQKNNLYILSGLTKTTYPSESTKALLGNLDYVWLINNLKNIMGLNDEDFLFKLNYN